jgi:hypothetical protein
MPLDGEDGLKMFCIMLPQDLARSTKTLRQSRDRSTSHIQAWRPYEIETNSNIEIFKNSFMLLGLRNTKGVRGTLQIVRAILGLPDSTNVGKRTTNTYLPSYRQSRMKMQKRSVQMEMNQHPKGRNAQTPVSPLPTIANANANAHA